MSSQNILKTSIGKKFAMGITGIFLITFLIVHCGVNALIFFNDGGILFTKAAHFMGTNWLIRTMEIVLFAGIIWHIVQALVLTLQNQKARPVQYAVVNGTANSKWYSRWMGLLGTLILIFLILHLNHFWVDSRITGIDHPPVIIEGHEYDNLYAEMKDVFENPIVVIIYVLAMFSLAYHLLHGFQSAFQSLGLNHKKYTSLIKAVGFWFSIIVPFVFALMPIAMYLGFVK
ncbi:MAG TPA: succinate dehydrogenase cytochrome b subunit [Bacteroidia bacterium]|nr:succinate dehydrogenase cytochrome b subunit [Bacteroidia bacterium]HNU33243.1 succinate dehydrogenase cytochrome b subunit [Bacteroidia bacterium]